MDVRRAGTWSHVSSALIPVTTCGSVAREGLRAGDGPQLLSERRADATPPARRMRRCDEPDTKPLYDCDLREC